MEHQESTLDTLQYLHKLICNKDYMNKIIINTELDDEDFSKGRILNPDLDSYLYIAIEKYKSLIFKEAQNLIFRDLHRHLLINYLIKDKGLEDRIDIIALLSYLANHLDELEHITLNDLSGFESLHIYTNVEKKFIVNIKINTIEFLTEDNEVINTYNNIDNLIKDNPDRIIREYINEDNSVI